VRIRARAPLLLLGAAAIAGLGAAPPAAPPAAWFVDATAELGVELVHTSGAAGRLFMPEIMGPGVALADLDGDGDLDLFFVQGGDLERPDAAGAPGPAFLRNELVGRGTLAFSDVTASSGLRPCAYGMGVATGDYDNDGRVDLYVTCLGSNQLWRNEGPGPDGVPRFRDVIQAAGADDPRWSVSAAFTDYDRDGWLDLFVANYLRFSPATHPACRTPAGAPDYCGPVASDAVADRLLRNRGDGTFEDVTARAGIGAADGPGLGVVAADLDQDGWLDLYVANDETANQLWLNQRDGTFRDEALLAGVALSGEGETQASMGLDAGDYDGDGDLDVAIANLAGEGLTLYRNLGDGLFEDASVRSGLRAASLRGTGFGLGWLDVDNDGWLDLLVVNGAIKRIPEQLAAGERLPLAQPKQLFRNLGDGRFEDVTTLGGPALLAAEVSRGAAFGDLDDDGDTDVVVANVDGPPRVLLARPGSPQPWLGLRLVTGGPEPRDALGALVSVERTGAPPLLRRAHADGSYASANDPRVLVGLGAASPTGTVTVTWPSGRKERFRGLVAGRYTTLREGSGEAP
jgi:hypothetical protein